MLLVLGWHLILPAVGATLALSTAAWGFVTASVVIACVGILLFFLLSGIWLLLIAVACSFWAVASIFAFPVLFPILIPLWITLMCIAYIRRRQNDSKEAEHDHLELSES